MATDRSRELAVAREAVDLAGRFALGHFGRPIEVERKADASPVTIADRGAEEILRRHLAAAFPDDGLLGEEHGESPGRSGRRWILDPIDGTQSFVRGVPLWGVLVGLEEDDCCVVGVIGLPALGRTLWAARGAGAFCNGEPIAVSKATSLGDATLLTSDARPQHYGARYAGFERLLRGVGRQRGWGACYGTALVATGQAEVMVDPQLNPWDCAAVVPIVEEAGGSFFAWDGRPTIYGDSGVAVPRALREPVLALLGD